MAPWLAFGLCAATAVQGSAPPQAVRHARVAARIDSLARAALTDGPIPGLSIAVTRGRETIVARGYGFASLEEGTPATAETVYPIASITKQLTAAAIMKLVERNQLRLKDDISKYLPDFPEQGHKVTVQQLLNHTAGIRNYTDLGARWLDQADVDVPPQEFVRLFRNEPFDFPPGERVAYSNSGYYLLGLVIERVSGESYGEYVR